MALHADWSEFLKSLNASRARFVVGAHALAVHGHPRFTGDLDVLVEPSPANARRVLAALEAPAPEFVELNSPRPSRAPRGAPAPRHPPSVSWSSSPCRRTE